MKPAGRLSIVLACVVALGTAASAQSRRWPPGGVIIGQVVDTAVGKGLDRSIVTLSGSTRFVIVTDAKGRFMFTGVPGGQYTVTATRSGYLPGAFGQRRPAGHSMHVTVTNGQWIKDVEVPLWRPAAITGIVTDDRGAPIIGTPVFAYRRDRNVGRPTTGRLVPEGRSTTDDRGVYRIAGLVPGDHIVGLSTPQFDDPTSSEPTFAPQYYPGADLASTASAVTTQSGREITGINFFVTPADGTTVTGTVDNLLVGEDRMRHVRLSLSRPRDASADADIHRVIATATPDEHGRFEFSRVPPGAFVLEAALGPAGAPIKLPSEAEGGIAGAVPETPPLPGAPEVYWARVPVVVERQPVDGIRVVLEPGIRSAGTAVALSRVGTPAPLSAGLAVVYRPEFEFASTVSARGTRADIKPDGTFETPESLLPGPYRVEVEGVPSGVTAVVRSAGGEDVSDVLLDLSDDVAAARNLRVEVSANATVIMGMVRGPGPLADNRATVLVFPIADGGGPRRYRATRVSFEGAFEFRELPPGVYAVVAIDDADATDWQAPERLRRWRRTATPVTLRAGEPRVLELRLEGVK